MDAKSSSPCSLTAQPLSSNFAAARRELVGAGLLHVVDPDSVRGFDERASQGDREGRGSERRIEPHGLLVEPPVWYILAVDLDKGAARTFRMDRIARPRLLDRTFRPDAEVVRAMTAHLRK